MSKTVSHSITYAPIKRYLSGSVEIVNDPITIESPLEIHLGSDDDPSSHKSVSITMRTPGNDTNLAIGFLVAEEIITDKNQIADIQQVNENLIIISVHNGSVGKIKKLDRNFISNSSCGVCGKSSIDSLNIESIYPLKNSSFLFRAENITQLQGKLLNQQSQFSLTGGIHAAAVFNSELELIQMKEDVGRHNAVDKILGHFFLQGELPLSEHLLLLSGRASFELVQKAAIAGLPIIVAVGAPSSLAIEMADKNGITLIGFLKHNSFNIYTHPDIIVPKALLIGPQIQKTFAKAYKRGVKIAFGTDSGVSLHGQNADEFIFMTESGMSNYEAIKSATVNSSDLMNISEKFGTIEKGKMADIIAVDDNPISNIHTLRNVYFVMKGGRVFKNGSN